MEMLVVIAIIAILSSMAGPGLLRAIDNARGVYCLNNLRNIYLEGVTAFIEDNNGYVPAPEKTTGGMVFSRYIGNEYMGYDANLSTQAGGTDWARARATSFICPADESPQETSSTTALIPTSYFLSNYSGLGGNHSAISKRITSIPKPSVAGYIADSNTSPSRGWNTLSHISFNHQDGYSVNVLWLAGNVSSLNQVELSVRFNLLNRGW